jgi:hypothetical protein
MGLAELDTSVMLARRPGSSSHFLKYQVGSDYPALEKSTPLANHAITPVFQASAKSLLFTQVRESFGEFR